jgi:hypothetical protein
LTHSGFVLKPDFDRGTSGGAEKWALADIEPSLLDLRNAIGIVGHLATAENEVSQEEWQYVEGNLIAIHARLETLWSEVWEQNKAEHQAHEAALVAAQDRTAAAWAQIDAMVFDDGVTRDVKTQTRRVFYAGAHSILDILMAGPEPENKVTEGDVDRTEALSEELRRFGEDVEAGRA